MCPACATLVHADRLRGLVARAEAHLAAGRLREARAGFDEALALLPAGSQQHDVISAKLTELAKQITDAAADEPVLKMPSEGPWWKRWGGGGAALGVLLLSKGKFLLLGLTKLKTFGSMFAFFGAYWALYGWPLALGLVMSIYVHEMGHVYAITKKGGKPSAPMFIPGLGAFVSYSKGITDPREDAYIGLAGPIWGAAAGLVAFAVANYTGSAIWYVIAQLTGWLNLFNLMPFFGLDGDHAFRALNRLQRWGVVAAIGLAFYFSTFKLLLLVGAVAVWKAAQREEGPGDANTLANFIGLIGVLSWMSMLNPN